MWKRLNEEFCWDSWYLDWASSKDGSVVVCSFFNCFNCHHLNILQLHSFLVFLRQIDLLHKLNLNVCVSVCGMTCHFCSYLIASMGLQVIWSSGLALMDAYALLRKKVIHNPVLVGLFVVGDWVRISTLCN